MITINVCWLLFQDNVPDSTLKKLKKYMENPKFVPETVEKTSKVYARALSCPAHTTALARGWGNGRRRQVSMSCKMVGRWQWEMWMKGQMVNGGGW